MPCYNHSIAKYLRSQPPPTQMAPLNPFLNGWNGRQAGCGVSQVRVEEMEGFAGVTEGLDTRGFLQVRTPEGLRTVYSGGVREIKEARGK